MRRFASFLLLGFALTAGATEIWRWKDADGVVHYSDSPVQGAERINVGPAPMLGSPSNDVVVTVSPGSAAQSQNASPVRYKRCSVAQPKNNETFFAVDSVGVSLAVDPPLRPGHRIEVYLNGAVDLKWPGTATDFTLTGLNRGAYTLAVRIQDDNGRTLCDGPVSNFYVRQPSVLSPQSPLRQKPGN